MFCSLTTAAILKSISESLETAVSNVTLKIETAFKAMETNQKQELDQLRESMKATQKQELDQIRGAMEATQREEFVQLQGTLNQRMDSIQSQLQMSSRRSSDVSTAGSRTSARLPIRVPGPISPPPILSPPLWGQSQNIRQFRCGSWPPPPIHPPPLPRHAPEPRAHSQSFFSPEVEADEVSVVMSSLSDITSEVAFEAGDSAAEHTAYHGCTNTADQSGGFPPYKQDPGKGTCKTASSVNADSSGGFPPLEANPKNSDHETVAHRSVIDSGFPPRGAMSDSNVTLDDLFGLDKLDPKTLPGGGEPFQLAPGQLYGQ